MMNNATRIITMGERDSAIVKQIQYRLNQSECVPVIEDGIFGRRTESAVKAYQKRVFDRFSPPLEIDGKVGPQTWARLFAGVLLCAKSASPFLEKVIKIAR